MSDSGVIQNLEHLDQGVVSIIKNVVIRQRNSIHSGSFKHGNVLCGGSEMKSLGIRGPGCSSIRDDTFEITEPPVCAMQNGEPIAPRVLWWGVLQDLIHQASEHAVADKQ